MDIAVNLVLAAFLSNAYNPCKQLGLGSEPTGSKPFDTPIVFLIYFSKQLILKSAVDNTRVKRYPACKESSQQTQASRL